jgi:hypothetical protein
MEMPPIHFVKQYKLYTKMIRGVNVEFWLYGIYKNGTFHTTFIYPEVDNNRPTYHRLAEYVIMIDSANFVGNETYIVSNLVMGYIVDEVIKSKMPVYDSYKFLGEQYAPFIGAINMALWRYLGSHPTIRTNIYKLYRATKSCNTTSN